MPSAFDTMPYKPGGEVIDRREAAPSSPTRPGFRADGAWRGTTEAERREMTFDQRWQHSCARPGDDADRAAAAEARRWTTTRLDGGWQERRFREQAARYGNGG